MTVMGSIEKLNRQDVQASAPEGWVLLVDGLQTRIAVDDLATGAALVAAIATAAGAGQHPVLTLRTDALDVRLTTPEVHGVTTDDVRFAAVVAALAQRVGLRPSTRGTSRLELALDTPETAAVAPFWAAVLDAPHSAGTDFGDEVRDRADALPTVWFQTSGSAEPRQRWHPDVWVAPAEVQDRIDAALAAGGTLVSDAEAPSFWTLADPDGNRVCLCTWQSRA